MAAGGTKAGLQGCPAFGPLPEGRRPIPEDDARCVAQLQGSFSSRSNALGFPDFRTRQTPQPQTVANPSGPAAIRITRM
jgi:hypothetical protein